MPVSNKSTPHSMVIIPLTKSPVPTSIQEDLENLDPECKELLLSLPREKGFRTPYIYFFQGFWCQPKEIEAIISFQKHFRARDTDVVLASIPKSGTTWLKALAFSIMNRKHFPVFSDHHPLLVSNPHDLVSFFEYKLYAGNQVPELSELSEPRLFATHIPFPSLQESIKKSSCRIIYICRNPLDTFVSSWIYSNKLRPETLPPVPLEDAFQKYCKGVIGFGPFWDHMLGYWKESLERPDKVLFLKYDDLKQDITSHLKKTATFLGCPFSVEEEREGVIEGIAKLCSFENLKDLEVNKSGKSIKNFENKHLFRKAETGDWVNYLPPSMARKLAQVMKDKLGGSGLQFKAVLQD
ncbi:Cytosolic sulfotransferase 15 [Turnera subulata]|uniref:Sulfotransferase n=1 Tax=Turnera subulata TaxID=218843 RepID=A0A9Q0F5Q4_9ROSI|nr:Cytosolic sulfotransferase 15 [Turnera subulata]